MGWRNIVDAVAFVIQDLGAGIKRAGERLESCNATKRDALGFKVSSWTDHKAARHIVNDANDTEALCGQEPGPFGWENINHVYDDVLWPDGVCPDCLKQFHANIGCDT